jgi:colicin import membrane protein
VVSGGSNSYKGGENTYTSSSSSSSSSTSAKGQPHAEAEPYSSAKSQQQSHAPSAKDEDYSSASSSAKDDSSFLDSKPADKRSGRSGGKLKAFSTGGQQNFDVPDPKPLKLRELKPLPVLKPLSGSGAAAGHSADFEERRKQAEEDIQRNREMLAEQRKSEEQLRNKLSQADIDARARHMAEQRERIIAAKKAEREAKVRVEEERKAKMGDDNAQLVESLKAVQESDAKGGASGQDVITEARRSAMRAALTRRLKMDLLDDDS